MGESESTEISETIFCRLLDDIIPEVLSRLPVKSLLKFRCVSKSWCSLISSKQFSKAHLKNSIKNTSFSHHCTVSIFPQSRHTYRLKHCPLPALFYQSSTAAEEFDFDIPMCLDKTCFVGCSNGLCCLFINWLNDKYFILWNPSTRKYKKTPNVFDSKFDPWLENYGFGYDESSDDYNIVAEVMFWDGDEYNPVVKIYSLKMNCWKLAGMNLVKDDGTFEKGGKFVNGKLHWARRVDEDTNDRLDIISFDLGSESVGVVEQPMFTAGNHFYPRLGVLGGCLSVLRDNGATGTEIWILKEYGVRESWYNAMTVPYIRNPPDRSIEPFSPLFIAPDGEVLLDDGQSLCIYNPNTNSFRRPAISNASSFHLTDVYVQNLLSPFLNDEPAEQN